MLDIKTVENFLTFDECNLILNSVKDENLWINHTEGFWADRSIDPDKLYKSNNEAGKLLLSIKNRIGNEIKKSFELSDEVYADLIQVIRWLPGMEQSPHCDDMTDTEDESLEWFKHRHFGCIIYLNDDYNGGKTYYPQHNLEITPKMGMLAMHKGTPDYMHGVTKIENSIRYTIASFWTFEKGYEHAWSLYE